MKYIKSPIIYHMTLSKKFGVSTSTTNRTIKRTTKHDSRTVLQPYRSIIFRTNYCASRYNRLTHNVFGDKLESGTFSKCGNIYDGLFAKSLYVLLTFQRKRRVNLMKVCNYYYKEMVYHLES